MACLALAAAAGAGALGLVQRARDVERAREGSRFHRGQARAEALGCFTCHGPEGTGGTANFVPDLDEVPSWGLSIGRYVKSPGELREWVVDGMPARMREDPAERQRLQEQLIRMPAYREEVGGAELEDLLFYLEALSGLAGPPAGSPAAAGRELAIRLGCLGCHGPEGRAKPGNPGSLKGHIPSWDSADYLELVRDDEEFREWVVDGAPRRLRENPLAARFLEAQRVQMPAYRDRVTEEEVGALRAYVEWIRTRWKE